MAADKADGGDERSETDVQDIHPCTPCCWNGVGLLRIIVWCVVECFRDSLLKIWQVSFAMETSMPEESFQSVILNYACPKAIISHKIRKKVEGTSRIILSNLSWQKHRLDKMVQHLLQMHFQSVQHLGIHHFPGDIIPKTDCSNCEKHSFFVQSESSQR